MGIDMPQILFLLSLLGIAAALLMYPILLRIGAMWTKELDCTEQDETDLPTVSCIVVARNAESLVDRKVGNCLELDYPPERLTILLASDGSTDGTAERMLRHQDKRRIHVQVQKEHAGKIAAMNRAVEASKGEILLFSDVDALLGRDCLRRMVKYYTCPDIGGVCGRMIFGEGLDLLKASQERYNEFSVAIQRLESRIGSVTQSNGKICTMRRVLYRPILNAVTDDFFIVMTVISLGFRFIYEAKATAITHLPSRNWRHEVERRRRIVSTSLRGILHYRVLLNPFRYGFYSIGLFLNKVVRRSIPFLLLLVFLSNIFLLDRPVFLILWLLQCALYAMSVAVIFLPRFFPGMPNFSKLLALLSFFAVGNLGTMLGVLDFLRGRKIDKWEPNKRESGPSLAL